MRVAGFTASNPRASGLLRTLTLLSPRSTVRGEGAFAPWVPVVLVAAALASGHWLPAWVWMWVLAWAIYFGCKWVTWWPLRRTATLRRSIGYLLADPGMNVEAILAGGRAPQPRAAEWGGAVVKTLAGAAFIWIVPRMLISRSPMLAGWAAMIGIALALHFGLLHLIALAWRCAGVDAEPLMNRPTCATSLADFWGRRWNMGFHTLAVDLIFAPLARRGLSPTIATAAVFAVSGLVHDAVISLPVRRIRLADDLFPPAIRRVDAGADEADAIARPPASLDRPGDGVCLHARPGAAPLPSAVH